MKEPEDHAPPLTDPRPRSRSPQPDIAPQRRSPLRRLAVWLVALAILGGGAYAGWSAWNGRKPAQTTAQRPAPAVPVGIAEVGTGDVPVYLNGLGTVQAFNSVLVRSRVDGEIVKIAFTEGQHVAKGDILVQIDPRPYQAALDQALAKKAQDEASLSSIRADLERTRKLATQSFATPQQLDQQTAQVAALEAQIKADQAAIENAQTQLDYTTIRSPLDGRTGIRMIDQGNIVRAADTTGIVEVVQLQPISVLFTAPEGQLGMIAKAKQQGQVDVAAIAPDGRSVIATGELSLINNQVDPATGTVRLKATFANQEDRLWPGLSVNTRLLAETLRGVTTIPDTAVLRSQTGLFAYVVEDGKAVRRDIKVGPITEGVAVIEDGLKPGEKVVSSGQSRLANGAPVKPAEDPGRDGQPLHNHVAAGPEAAGRSAKTGRN